MRITIGCDRGGLALKAALAEHLRSQGHEVEDLGGVGDGGDGYPGVSAVVARSVVNGRAELGIVIGSSGQGEQIAANKVHGIRAVVCSDEYTARLARAHTNANVCALGARILAPEYAISVVDVFLATPFAGGEHEQLLAQIADIEQEESDGVRARSGS